MATPEREVAGQWPHQLQVGCSLSKLQILALNTKAAASRVHTDLKDELRTACWEAWGW